ncbi:ABC transporter ATP-binding protein [Paenibacillus sp. FSL H3-0333]|uniref:ABC transporter ATP-binding protein n=1 Tax=Paenibacillus sp. FSL H3-0333 TaxID=2921373 RepID=UPI0030F6D2B4
MKVVRALFRQSKLIYALLIIALIFFSILILQFTINFKQATLEVKTTNNYKGKNLYQLSDDLYNEKEKEFFSNENSMKLLNNFSGELDKRKHLNYYISKWQPIEITDFKGDVHFDAYYEEGNNQPAYKVNGRYYRMIKSLQLNEKVFELNNVQLSDGQLFRSEDFVYDGEKEQIPMLLGSNYNGIYKIGDTIDFIYYQHSFKGIVTGIVGSSQKILSIADPELFLDSYIIFPLMSFNNNVNLQSNGLFIKASLLTQINGMLITDLSPLQVRKELANVSQSVGFSDFQIIGANTLAINSLVKMTEANRNTLLLITGIMGLITTLLLFWSITMIIKRNFDVYKIFLVSGASMSRLYSITRNQFIVGFAISAVLPLIPVFYLIYKPLPIIINYSIIITSIYALLIFIANVSIRYTFKRLDIVQHLKG